MRYKEVNPVRYYLATGGLGPSTTRGSKVCGGPAIVVSSRSDGSRWMLLRPVPYPVHCLKPCGFLRPLFSSGCPYAHDAHVLHAARETSRCSDRPRRH
jgi:hypothetical protein